MIDYEVGQRPATNLGIDVKDQFDNPRNLVGYATVEIEMIGSDNERVDVTGVEVQAVPNALGRFAIVWPKDRSLFTKKGKYLLRLWFRKPDGSADPTRPVEIRVREFGRLNN